MPPALFKYFRSRSGDEMMFVNKDSKKSKTKASKAKSSTEAAAATSSTSKKSDKKSSSPSKSITSRSSTKVAAKSTLKEAAAAAAAVPPPVVEEMPHPALKPYFVMDTTTGERIVPNSSKAYQIENDWFSGNMMILIRTPNVDQPDAFPPGNADNHVVTEYMSTKQRRFEFQFQIRLKQLPTPDQRVYFSCELNKPTHLSPVYRALVGAAMAFVKSTNPSFHYSLMGTNTTSSSTSSSAASFFSFDTTSSEERRKEEQKQRETGMWEKPHMSFLVESSLDRVVVTKPGETPPELGSLIEESVESIQRRKKSGYRVDWNLEDTYTLALWSSYVDFLDWNVINLPAIRPFSLARVIGDQSIFLTLYLISEGSNDKGKGKSSKKSATTTGHHKPAEFHYRKDITQVVELELSNSHVIPPGQCAKQWIGRHQHSNEKAAMLKRMESVSVVGSSSTSSKRSSKKGSRMSLDRNKRDDRQRHNHRDHSDNDSVATR